MKLFLDVTDSEKETTLHMSLMCVRSVLTLMVYN